MKTIALIMLTLVVPIREYGFDLVGDEPASFGFDLVGSSVANETKAERSRQIWIFSASWCGPCRLFKAQRERLVKSGWKFGDKSDVDAHFREVDVDADPQLWAKMTSGVQYIPAFVLVVDGRPVQTITGFRTAEQVAQFYSTEAVR